jgi:hypothetical protein
MVMAQAVDQNHLKPGKNEPILLKKNKKNNKSTWRKENGTDSEFLQE